MAAGSSHQGTCTPRHRHHHLHETQLCNDRPTESVASDTCSEAHTHARIQVTRAPAPAPVVGPGRAQNQDTWELTNTTRLQVHSKLLWRQPPGVSTRSRQGRLRPRLSRQCGCSLPSTRTTPGRGALQPQGRADATAIATRTEAPKAKGLR